MRPKPAKSIGDNPIIQRKHLIDMDMTDSITHIGQEAQESRAEPDLLMPRSLRQRTEPGNHV